MRRRAIPTVQIDNSRIIETEWRFPPNAETSHLVKGHSYTRQVGVSHNVINPGPGGVIFVEVEIR